MKKRFMSLALCICLSLMGLSVAGAEDLSGMINPMEYYETFDELCEAMPGIRMALPPEDAEDISYATINGIIAQIEFSWDADFYTYRAAPAKDDDENEDIDGIYADFDDDLDDDAPGKLELPSYVDDFDFKYNHEDGQVLVTWYCENCAQRFSLYSETAGNPEMRMLFLLMEYPEYIVCHAQ